MISTSPLDTPWPQAMSAGALCLDYVNALDWRGRAQPVETFHQYADVVRFALKAGVLDRAQAQSLLAWAERHPKRSARALERARATRETIAVLVKSLADGRAVTAADLASLQADVQEASEGRALLPAANGARWGWAEGDIDPDRPRWAAALDAERLLTLEGRAPIRECEGQYCGWFFLDTSRNRKRRWCSMEACGNRAKAQRFYRKKKTSAKTTA